MRGFAVLALASAVLAVLLAGCSGDDGNACSDLPDMRGTVETHTGRDVQVRLPDGEPLVLHLSSQVFVKEGEACTLTGPDGLRVGDELAFHVDEVAESYPPQGWPDVAVALR